MKGASAVPTVPPPAARWSAGPGRRARLARVLALAAAAFTAAGPAAAQDASPAPADAPPSAHVALDCAAFVRDAAAGATVAVALGGPVLVELCAEPATGYRWSAPVVADPAIVAVRAWTYATVADARAGAAGTERFLLHATAAGSTTVTFSYDRPWAGGDVGARVAIVAVTVAAASALPTASPAIPREAAGAEGCCAASVVSWGNPILVMDGGTPHALPSGTGSLIAGRGTVTVTWMDGFVSRLELGPVADGYRVRWLDADGRQELAVHTFRQVGEDAWLGVGPHNVHITYADGTDSRLGAPYAVEIEVFE